MKTYALNIGGNPTDGYMIEDLNDVGTFISDGDGNNTFETLDEAIDVRNWFLMENGTDDDNGMSDGKKTFEYIHNEAIGDGVFDIIRLPDGELLFSFLDKRGWYNVFNTIAEYTFYVEGSECERVCFENAYIEEDEEGYEEGVDALERYLRTLV